jgi:hypothetical protein
MEPKYSSLYIGKVFGLFYFKDFYERQYDTLGKDRVEGELNQNLFIFKKGDYIDIEINENNLKIFHNKTEKLNVIIIVTDVVFKKTIRTIHIEERTWREWVSFTEYEGFKHTLETDVFIQKFLDPVILDENGCPKGNFPYDIDNMPKGSRFEIRDHNNIIVYNKDKIVIGEIGAYYPKPKFIIKGKLD